MKEAFVYDPFKDVPVRFGFSDEEREYLKKTRSIDEIMDFIDEYRLALGMDLAERNNDIGFSSRALKGEYYQNDKGEIFFRQNSEIRKNGIPQEIRVGDPENFDSSWLQADPSKKIYHEAVCLEKEGTVTVHSVEDPEGDGSYSEKMRKEITKSFLTYAGVDSYHKLGRLINKGQKIFNQWRAAQHGVTK